MNKKRSPLYARLSVVSILACFLLSVPFTGYTVPKKIINSPGFTAKDAKVLKGSDHEAVAEVLAKLSKLYQARGKESLMPAVEPLIESAWNELRIPEDQRWNLVDIMKILALSGDTRIKPLFLTIMSTVKGGGMPYVPQGFLSLGSSIVPELADSLKSIKPDVRGRATLTLNKMSQLDKSGAFFSSDARKLIKERLIANLKDANASIRMYSVSALAFFGDSSVVPALEYIEKHDAHKDSSGTYEVRIEAGKTLKILKSKK
jgi:hypothetical protein